MKRGFTLLELIVVVIILGVLATLGFQQYARAIERSRGAEAKTIIGQVRSAAVAFYTERGTLNNFTNALAGIGTGADQIPSAPCRVTHYFTYAVDSATGDALQATGTRCVGANGKQPGASTAFTLILNSDFSDGTDNWSGTGGY